MFYFPSYVFYVRLWYLVKQNVTMENVKYKQKLSQTTENTFKTGVQSAFRWLSHVQALNHWLTLSMTDYCIQTTRQSSKQKWWAAESHGVSRASCLWMSLWWKWFEEKMCLNCRVEREAVLYGDSDADESCDLTFAWWWECEANRCDWDYGMIQDIDCKGIERSD